jgi:hypothetical protein
MVRPQIRNREAAMEKIRKFLQGKKTYISAAALALVAILGWWLGAVDNTNASALLCAAGALAGLGAKSQRTAEAVLVAISDLRDAQEAHARGQKVDLFKFAAQIGSQVIPGIVPLSAVPGEQSYPYTASFTVPFSSVAAPGARCSIPIFSGDSPKPADIKPPSVLPIPPKPETKS